jgi:hypothetical protein
MEHGRAVAMPEAGHRHMLDGTRFALGECDFDLLRAGTMPKPTFGKEITGLVVIDPYNDVISEEIAP